VWSGSEDDSGAVYLRTMVREFCTALGTLVLSGLSAQNDTIFPNVNGSWHYTEFYYLGNGDPPEALNSWSQDYAAEPSFELGGFHWGSLEEQGGTIGRIAVDSGRVYFRALVGWDMDTNLVHVLYDFNLNLGDTAYMTCDGFAAEVYSVDTTLLSGRARRRFQLSNGDLWIEGVGSAGGLLVPLFCPCVECSYSIQEFCGTYIDMDAVDYATCWPLDLAVEEAATSLAAVYPNPSEGSFSITTQDARGTFRVVDLRGSLIASGSLRGPCTAVHLMQPRTGHYILEVNGHRTKLIIE
jgi:hypothetical protein